MVEKQAEETPVDRIVMRCPFCGGTKVNIIEGGTFRWRRAECQECEAMAGAVRIQTTGDGTHDEWEKSAADAAFKRWNERQGDPCRTGCKITRAVQEMNNSLTSNY